MAMAVFEEDKDITTLEGCRAKYGDAAVFDGRQGVCYHRVGRLRGEAEDMDVDGIADRHGVHPANIESQLRKGTIIEKEHTPNRKIARLIALDHLAETPDYYTRLEEMEKEAKESDTLAWETRGKHSPASLHRQHDVYG